MATASAGRADKGSSRGSRAFRAPLQRDRLAVGGQGRGEEKPKARQPSSCAQTQGATMSDPEIEELRDKVHCAVVLERTPPPWKLDRKESTKLSLKYRRGKGEILIVSHGGTRLVGSDQRRQGRCVRSRPEAATRDQLRSCPQAPARIRGIVAELSDRRKGRAPQNLGQARSPNVGPIGRPCGRIRRPGATLPESASFHRRSSRRLPRPASCGRARPAAPGSLISTARVPSPTSTFAGRPAKGSLAGGRSSSFRLPPSAQSFPRLVLAEAAIDALSVAAIESLRADTLYAASGGGMGPGTIAALEALLTAMATLPGALFCSATDANGPGDRFAERHRSLAEKFSVPFARLRPPIEGGDWNDVLRARSQHQGSTS